MGQSPDSKTYNEEGAGLPFYQGNADFGEVHPITRVWCSSPAKVASEGDILISVRAPIGAMNIATETCCIGRGLAALTANKERCNRQFLFYALQSKVELLISKGTGSTFKAISKKILEETLIPIYSIKEQEEIADKIEHIDQAITDRKKQLVLLERLVKSRFIELFGNTETNPRGLPVVPWQEVFLTTTGKLDSNAMVEGGKYPFFTCAKEIFRIDTYAFDCEALLLAGNNAAGVYDVKHYKGKFNAYQRTYVLRLINEQWSYKLFKRQLEDKLSYLQSQSKGTNTRYLTLGILNELQFLVPPLEEQKAFTFFVEQVDKSKLYGEMEVAA
jgi:restriction endonuclease S subunit